MRAGEPRIIAGSAALIGALAWLGLDPKFGGGAIDAAIPAVPRSPAGWSSVLPATAMAAHPPDTWVGSTARACHRRAHAQPRRSVRRRPQPDPLGARRSKRGSHRPGAGATLDSLRPASQTWPPPTNWPGRTCPGSSARSRLRQRKSADEPGAGRRGRSDRHRHAANRRHDVAGRGRSFRPGPGGHGDIGQCPGVEDDHRPGRRGGQSDSGHGRTGGLGHRDRGRGGERANRSGDEMKTPKTVADGPRERSGRGRGDLARACAGSEMPSKRRPCASANWERNRARSATSSKRSTTSPNRRTCWRSTPPSRQPGRASRAGLRRRGGQSPQAGGTSSRATKEIAALIAKVQRETDRAVGAMRVGAGEVRSGSDLAERSPGAGRSADRGGRPRPRPGPGLRGSRSDRRRNKSCHGGLRTDSGDRHRDGRRSVR